MDALKNLAQLVKIDLSKARTGNFHFLSDNKSSSLVTVNNYNININLQAARPDQAEQLREIIPKLIQENGIPILDKEAAEKVDKIASLESGKEIKDLISYFRGKLSPADLEILRAAVFIKSEHDQNRDVSMLRHEVEMKYGRKGIVISNLYSAGYFESLIKPLYEEMSKLPDFTVFSFRNKFSVIVREYTFAVFVSVRRTKEEIEEEVRRKMEINKQYGIHKLNIHGIGRDNVEKVQLVLQSLKNEIDSPPVIDSGSGYINVSISY